MCDEWMKQKDDGKTGMRINNQRKIDRAEQSRDKWWMKKEKKEKQKYGMFRE